MIANTLDTPEARKELLKIADSFSITEKKKEPEKRPKTFKLITGEELPISEMKNYTYEEVDHTDEDSLRIKKVMKENKGANLFNLSGFTRGPA